MGKEMPVKWNGKEIAKIDLLTLERGKLCHYGAMITMTQWVTTEAELRFILHKASRKRSQLKYLEKKKKAQIAAVKV